MSEKGSAMRRYIVVGTLITAVAVAGCGSSSKSSVSSATSSATTTATTTTPTTAAGGSSVTVPIRDQIVTALKTDLHAKEGQDNVLQYPDPKNPANLCTVAAIVTTKTDIQDFQRAGVAVAANTAGDAGVKVIGSTSSADCVGAAMPVLADLHQ